MPAIDCKKEQLIEEAEELMKLILQKQAVHDYQTRLISRPKRLTCQLIKERNQICLEIDELIKKIRRIQWEIREMNRKKEWEWWK